MTDVRFQRSETLLFVLRTSVGVRTLRFSELDGDKTSGRNYVCSAKVVDAVRSEDGSGVCTVPLISDKCVLKLNL